MPTSAPAQNDDTRVFITDVAGAGNGRSNSLPGRTRSLGGSPWPFVKLSPSPLPRSDFPFHPEGGTCRPPGRDEKVPSEACHLRRGERRNPRVRWPLPREARAVDRPRAGRGMQGARSTRGSGVPRRPAERRGPLCKRSERPTAGPACGGRLGHRGDVVILAERPSRPPRGACRVHPTAAQTRGPSLLSLAGFPSCAPRPSHWPRSPYSQTPLPSPATSGPKMHCRLQPPLRPLQASERGRFLSHMRHGPLAAGRAPFLAPYVRYAAAPLICPS